MITVDHTPQRLTLRQDGNVLFSLGNPLNNAPTFFLTGNDVMLSRPDTYSDRVLYHAPDEATASEVLTRLCDAVQNMHKSHPLRSASLSNKILFGVATALAAATFMFGIWAYGYITGMENNMSRLSPPVLTHTEVTESVSSRPLQRARDIDGDKGELPKGIPEAERALTEPVATRVPESAPDGIASPVYQPSASASAQPPVLPSRQSLATVAKRPPQAASRLTPEEFKAAQAALAANLKRAAGKKTFTVSLSSGHPRTLYVFADPDCQNCRVFEPTLQALSGSVNVEIFPVTLVGKDDTVAKVVPLLCAPAETRAVLWRNLFDVGAGMRDLKHPAKALPACNDGKAALARNDNALHLFHLPGTPTVIADDGRMVPFIAMRSQAALDAFLNGEQ